MSLTAAPLLSSPSALSRRPSLVRCPLRKDCRVPRRRSRIAAQYKSPQEIGQELVQTVQQECRNFLERYDVVSTGVGALTVTTYCVWRGQDPWLALSITAASVVTALVVNELLYGNQQERR